MSFKQYSLTPIPIKLINLIFERKFSALYFKKLNIINNILVGDFENKSQNNFMI